MTQSKEGRVTRTLGPNSTFGEHERLGLQVKRIESEAAQPAAQELLGEVQERLAAAFARHKTFSAHLKWLERLVAPILKLQVPTLCRLGLATSYCHVLSTLYSADDRRSFDACVPNSAPWPFELSGTWALLRFSGTRNPTLQLSALQEQALLAKLREYQGPGPRTRTLGYRGFQAGGQVLRGCNSAKRNDHGFHRFFIVFHRFSWILWR